MGIFTFFFIFTQVSIKIIVVMCCCWLSVEKDRLGIFLKAARLRYFVGGKVFSTNSVDASTLSKAETNFEGLCDFEVTHIGEFSQKSHVALTILEFTIWNKLLVNVLALLPPKLPMSQLVASTGFRPLIGTRLIVPVPWPGSRARVPVQWPCWRFKVPVQLQCMGWTFRSFDHRMGGKFRSFDQGDEREGGQIKMIGGLFLSELTVFDKINTIRPLSRPISVIWAGLGYKHNSPLRETFSGVWLLGRP